MLRYLSLRLLYTLPVIWLVVSLVFVLIHLVPGDPIQQMLGEGAPAADIQAARHAYGLDAPLGKQYLNYWKGVLRGDLGPSLRYNQNVGKLIVQILFAQGRVESISMTSCLNVRGRGAFSEHLLNGIAGDKMDKHENQRDHEPDHRQRIQQAQGKVAEH